MCVFEIVCVFVCVCVCVTCVWLCAVVCMCVCVLIPLTESFQMFCSASIQTRIVKHTFYLEMKKRGILRVNQKLRIFSFSVCVYV